MAQSPLLPLDLRIRTIEAQLFGVPNSISETPSHSTSTVGKPATRRLRDVQESLERLGSSSEGIKRLIDGYNQYLPLLTLPTASNPSAQNDDPSVTPSTQSQSIREEDLLPDSVKLAMILEAAGDITTAERDLREVEILKGRGVEGSGDLEELIPLRGELVKAMQESTKQGTELDKARNEVGHLLMRYNEFTDTASELFLDLHHQLEALEEGVAKLERKKRKEIASRY
ncbi:hypothetical protein CI109_104340 [Kwoniella shandongensis]|uniref:Uncharacterized protein n=1 Tax=Kwoniella shandongensis TaxID=1734106 RepID=A0A5M6BX31_9TREE|nr:uncharacterized protein CI109_004264 [Kwoniella shandongensis]KAA5527447.1 hypothetical protein CI109_004264 [Kwoniella shandongensis]